MCKTAQFSSENWLRVGTGNRTRAPTTEQSVLSSQIIVPLELKTFQNWLLSQGLSTNYKREINKKITPFWGKRIYNNPQECLEAIRTNLQDHKPDKYGILAFRLLLRFLELQKIPIEQTAELRRHLKNKKSNPDMFVPTNEQVFDTLNKLKFKNQILFCIYLTSGLRKIEGKYLYENFRYLKAQQCNNFVKINLASFRKTKTAYFCYLPTWLYELLETHATQLSVKSLDSEITTHKLIAPKYCRKWFYTKCIELGIPESIADFYEGRTSGTIGANHYLGKQALGDKYYGDFLTGEFKSISSCLTLNARCAR
ncbi:MAG: hypothetical protein A2034_06835 [Elusimicrobia bacterium GWA2_38_7]|nr:MAG: hypothetical protein A2034_06835 [Elusimicrobia bacterium GWA2_38_7]